MISSKLAEMPELKKYMKRVMPFVQATRESLQRVGVDALSVALPFDEAAVLADNLQYLLNTLDVSRRLTPCSSFGVFLDTAIASLNLGIAKIGLDHEYVCNVYRQWILSCYMPHTNL